MTDLKDLPPPEKKEDNESLQLDTIGQETLIALLSSKTKTEAAERLSIDRSTLYQRIDKYKLDKLLEEIPKRALQQLQLGSIVAAETLTKLAESTNKELAFEVSKEVLNRVGVGQTTQAPQLNMNMGLLINGFKNDRST